MRGRREEKRRLGRWEKCVSVYYITIITILKKAAQQ